MGTVKIDTRPRLRKSFVKPRCVMLEDKVKAQERYQGRGGIKTGVKCNMLRDLVELCHFECLWE